MVVPLRELWVAVQPGRAVPGGMRPTGFALLSSEEPAEKSLSVNCPCVLPLNKNEAASTDTTRSELRESEA